MGESDGQHEASPAPSRAFAVVRVRAAPAPKGDTNHAGESGEMDSGACHGAPPAQGKYCDSKYETQ